VEEEKMTDEVTKQFLSCARAELVRVQIALSEMPLLKHKEDLLRDILALYGEKHIGEGVAVEISKPVAVSLVIGIDDERTVPLSERTVDRLESREEPEEPNLPGAYVSVPRPPGIPTNFQMMFQILDAGPPEGMVATVVINKIRNKWWPNVTFRQIAPEFYRYVKEGRLNRDDHGRMTLTEKGRLVARNPGAGLVGGKPNPKVQKHVPKPAPRALSEEQIERARAKAALNSKDADATSPLLFEHDGKTVGLDPDHWRIADHLYRCMGSGCIDTAKLASVSMAKGISSQRFYVEDAVTTINRVIEPLKLSIEPYQKLGFFMRERA
jgi:hypothetical protein